ncbi:MAG: hypothetical protein JNL72_01805 [Flavipsychrobacter sp.]|nr:hypothetical protein [Flavipsychrobacter sp.]
MRILLKITLLLAATCLLPQKATATGEDVCECVKLKVGSADTLAPNTYLDYRFSVKNTCKSKVWVNTSSFGFAIYDQNNKPARRLRELTFVKRYKYPEFVLIEPNAEYEFKFSDDAFFEYKMDRNSKYIVGLRFANKKYKHPSGRNLNFLCTKELKRLLYVK